MTSSYFLNIARAAASSGAQAGFSKDGFGAVVVVVQLSLVGATCFRGPQEGLQLNECEGRKWGKRHFWSFILISVNQMK